MLDTYVFSGVGIGLAGLVFGLMFGFMWGETSSDKKRQAEEQREKQQQMWNDYLDALKGGRYERR